MIQNSLASTLIGFPGLVPVFLLRMFTDCLSSSVVTVSTGRVTLCLKKLQNWCSSFIFEEYQRFSAGFSDMMGVQAGWSCQRVMITLCWNASNTRNSDYMSFGYKSMRSPGDMLGADEVIDMQPVMAYEEFAFYQEATPGYFFMLGMQDVTKPRHKCVHSSYFMLNEGVIPYGAALHASLAARYLLSCTS
ncbi:hypothetical protein V6N11_002885 [Hibiscus sabdariffa]|uniref:Uncharacterized protein n=1 Tax=Hibiscus sabdariffa TaxID=183260 RepID=A0ABR2SBM0_9ROSI